MQEKKTFKTVSVQLLEFHTYNIIAIGHREFIFLYLKHFEKLTSLEQNQWFC